MPVRSSCCCTRSSCERSCCRRCTSAVSSEPLQLEATLSAGSEESAIELTVTPLEEEHAEQAVAGLGIVVAQKSTEGVIGRWAAATMAIRLAIGQRDGKRRLCSCCAKEEFVC